MTPDQTSEVRGIHIRESIEVNQNLFEASTDVMIDALSERRFNDTLELPHNRQDDDAVDLPFAYENRIFQRGHKNGSSSVDSPGQPSEPFRDSNQCFGYLV